MACAFRVADIIGGHSLLFLGSWGQEELNVFSELHVAFSERLPLTYTRHRCLRLPLYLMSLLITSPAFVRFILEI